MAKSENESNSGIELSDLVGSLVKVEYVSMTSGYTKKGQETKMITVKANGKTVEFGVIGDFLESILKHGLKENGKILLEIPESLLIPTESNKPQWLNYDY